MNKQDYNYTGLGMLAGIVIGSGLGIILFASLGGAIYLSLSGVGAAVGMLLGNGFEQRKQAR